MLGRSAGRKGSPWKITLQKEKTRTLVQGCWVNKVKVQRNSAVNEEQDNSRQQVQSETHENGKEAMANTRVESPISVRIVQMQVEHPVDGILEVTAQVQQEISPGPNKEKAPTAGELILHEVSTTQVPPELMTEVMTVSEVHREFSPYQTHSGRAPGDERRSVEPDSTTNTEEHPEQHRSVEEDRSLLMHSDTDDPDGLGTLCIELNTDEQTSDECNPEGPSQNTTSTQQGPSEDTVSTHQEPTDADSTMEPASDNEYYTAIEHCSWFSTPARPEESGTSQQAVDQTLVGSRELGTRQNGPKKTSSK